MELRTLVGDSRFTRLYTVSIIDVQKLNTAKHPCTDVEDYDHYFIKVFVYEFEFEDSFMTFTWDH